MPVFERDDQNSHVTDEIDVTPLECVRHRGPQLLMTILAETVAQAVRLHARLLRFRFETRQCQ